MDYKDIAIRAGKTAVQAFGGVFVPVLVTYLNGGWPESWDSAFVALAPTFSAALAAAISALWNGVAQWLGERGEE